MNPISRCQFDQYFAGHSGGMDLDKVNLLVPKEFPYSGNQTGAYDVLDLDALVSGDAALKKVRAVAAAGHRKIGADDIGQDAESGNYREIRCRIRHD